MVRLARSLERRGGERDSPDDDDDDDDALVEEMLDASNAGAPSSLGAFQMPQVASKVMGPQYAMGNAASASFRESKVKEAESLMSSNDKKRLVRLLMETNNFCEDVDSAFSASLCKRPLGDLLVLANSKGLEAASAAFQESQDRVTGVIQRLAEKLRFELGLVYLANDKNNPHGFAAIDKMKSDATLELFTDKYTRDQWSKACSSLDKVKNNRKRKSHGDRNANRRRKKANAGQKPALPTCAACGKVGHVAGDAVARLCPRTENLNNVFRSFLSK